MAGPEAIGDLPLVLAFHTGAHSAKNRAGLPLLSVMPAAALIAFLVTAVKAFTVVVAAHVAIAMVMSAIVAFTVMVAVVIAFRIRIILQRSFSAPAGSSPLWA